MAAKAGFLLARCQLRVSEDWVVADAVICEPVSAANSQLTGKFTGNFAFLELQRTACWPQTAVPQALLGSFPMQINREKNQDNRDQKFKNREFKGE
jgi:hypothetical protein